MKKATLKSLLSGIALMVLTSSTLAGNNGGVIHFQGAIVEGGCGFIPQGQVVSISCSKHGKPATYDVALKQLSSYSVQSDSPVRTDLRYLDERRTLAVLDISYQ